MLLKQPLSFLRVFGLTDLLHLLLHFLDVFLDLGRLSIKVSDIGRLGLPLRAPVGRAGWLRMGGSSSDKTQSQGDCHCCEFHFNLSLKIPEGN